MNKAKTKDINRKDGLKGAMLLAIVLAVLFWRSFLPGYVHFSNDGPLGQQATACSQLPSNFAGAWGDTNDIGSTGGAWPLSLSVLLRWVLGPVGYSKFYAPFALFILGLGVWTFFRSLKLSWLASVMGTLAVVLNTCFFAGACWGVASAEIAIGFDFMAMGLFLFNDGETSNRVRWLRLALAGMCIGINVMEAADIGVMCSVLVAGFMFFRSLLDAEGSTVQKALRGVGRVAVVALFAFFISISTVISLLGTPGLTNSSKSVETPEAHWDWATQWSLPKQETLGIMVPGLFGYRLDTPKDMDVNFRDKYNGGVYWGGIGRDPNIDRYLDRIYKPGDDVGISINTAEYPHQTIGVKIGTDGMLAAPSLDPIKAAGLSGLQLKETIDQAYVSRSIEGAVAAPGGLMRFGYAGYYAGVLVVLVAFWALVQSFRRQNPVFTRNQSILIWFWSFIMIASLLVAWGRFEPAFYGLLYKLPHFSSIRNPVKFEIFFAWSLAILFGYGMDALSRRYLNTEAPAKGAARKWDAVDQKLIFGFAGLLVAGVAGWYYYSKHTAELVQYLRIVGYGDENFAQTIANFSVNQAGWFVFLLAGAVALLALVVKGFFSGSNAKLGAGLLLAFMVFDLGRANLPYIVHWDYIQKYEVGSLNPIETILKDKPYEHRVAKLLPAPLQTPGQFELFDQLYGIEWTQHHFLYYNIQCLDVIQAPRQAEEVAAYQEALRIGIKQRPDGQWTLDDSTFYKLPRKWQLSNTRYLLGPAAYADSFNVQFDGGRNRFHILQRFRVGLKPGLTEFHQNLEELTAFPDDNGDYALYEFTGALPRVKLYGNWQVNTNDTTTLETLGSQNFDPQKTVLISTPPAGLPAVSTNENTGTVDFTEYSSKHIVFSANATAPAVMLFNDRYDEHWRVLVDGKPATLMRCNFIMRGVYLQPGQHTITFDFSLPNNPLYVTLATMSVGFFLCGWLYMATRKRAAKT